MDQRTLLGKIEALFRNHRDRLGYGFSLALKAIQSKLERGEHPTQEDTLQVRQIEDVIARNEGLGRGRTPPHSDLPPTSPDVSLVLPKDMPFSPLSQETATRLDASLGNQPLQPPKTPSESPPPVTPPPTVIQVPFSVQPPRAPLPTPSHPSVATGFPTQFSPGGVPPSGPPTPPSGPPASPPGGWGGPSSHTQVLPPSLPAVPPPLPPPQYQKPDTSKDDNWLNRLLNRLGGRGQDVKDSENKYLDTHKKLFEAQLKFNRAPQEFKFAEAEYERAFKDREAARQAGTLSAKESERVEEARRKLREARKGMQEAPDELAEAQKIHDQARADYRANKGRAGNRLGLGSILRGLGFENVGKAMGEEGEERRLHQLAAAGNQQAAQQLGQLRAGRALQGLQNIGGGIGRAANPNAGIGGTVAGGGQVAQGVGQSLQSFGGRLGVVGAVVSGLGIMVRVVGESVDRLRKWGDALQESHYKFAAFSGSMSEVMAEEERRTILLHQERGERRAPAARALMEERTRFQRNVAPMEDWFSSKWSGLATFFTKLANDIIDAVKNKKEEEKKPEGEDLNADMFEVMRSRWDLNRFPYAGRPNRFGNNP